MRPRPFVARPRRMALLAVVLLATACGSSGPTGSPYAPIVRVVKQGQFVALPSAGADFANAVNATVVAVVNNPVSGASLHASVSWTSSSDKLEAGFFTGECTADQILSQACPVERYVPTAELVTGRTLDVYGANAGKFTFAIVNFGPGAESGTYEVDLVLPTSASAY